MLKELDWESLADTPGGMFADYHPVPDPDPTQAAADCHVCINSANNSSAGKWMIKVCHA